MTDCVLAVLPGGGINGEYLIYEDFDGMRTQIVWRNSVTGVIFQLPPAPDPENDDESLT